MNRFTAALLAGGFLGYVLMMFTNPIRASLRDGLRCLQRYRSLWMILAGFGFCYALFDLGLRVFEFHLLPDEHKPVFQWQRAWFLPEVERLEIAWKSVLPAGEAVAGLFNMIVATFPFSAIAAALLFVNYDGHLGVLARALQKRFGKAGWLFFSGILVRALAAIVKPMLYFGLVYVDRFETKLLLLQASVVVDWLSFLFEYLFGVCIQLYLTLLILVWIRGLNFTSRHLLDMAIRRFSFVVKWAVVVMILSTLALHLPLILAHFESFARFFPLEPTLEYTTRWARPLIAVVLVAFASVQITLTFHSEALAKALRDHGRFLRNHWWPFLWLLVIAALHFYALAFLREALVRGWGDGTPLGLAWNLFAQPLLVGLVSAWMLATWVCLFKRCEAGPASPENYIRY